MRVQLRTLFALSLGAFAVAGCRTGAGAKLKDDEAVAPANDDFCVGPRSLDDLKKPETTRDDWAKTFKEGKASAELIPSADHPGVMTPGQGFPRIFAQTSINNIANKVWGGKTMVTKNGETKLINRFLQRDEGERAINLFTAKVVLDSASKWSQSDGKPVILLDYRQTKLANSSGDESFNVPIIKAVRDEIRLVCQSTDANGVRKRLYLGPTFLLPAEVSSIDVPVKALAKKFEHEPILWFALEYTEEPAGAATEAVPPIPPSEP
jgi:hypothetical protein